MSLAKHMLRLGEVIDLVGRELKPHQLCAYLYDLATKYSGFFENCPVLQSEEPIRSSRLTLCEAAGLTLGLGLELLGIEHPDQM
jgi:arginyl-tRNA synthetase